jgi:hypothetical protein
MLHTLSETFVIVLTNALVISVGGARVQNLASLVLVLLYNFKPVFEMERTFCGQYTMRFEDYAESRFHYLHFDFWFVTLFGRVGGYQRFGDSCCFHPQSTLK